MTLPEIAEPVPETTAQAPGCPLCAQPMAPGQDAADPEDIDPDTVAWFCDCAGEADTGDTGG